MAFSEHAGAAIKGRNNHSVQLSVSRSSSKIAKPSSSTLRPLAPQHQVYHLSKNNSNHNQAAAAPPPKIYSTDPTSFRNLVQELTGTATPNSTPPPPSTIFSFSRPVNSRLQKIAPPPLKSVSSASFQPKYSSHSMVPLTAGDPSRSPLAELLSPPKSNSHFFPSASSATPAPPGDGVMWPSNVPLDSPYTAAIRQLAQRIVESENFPPGQEVLSDSPSKLPCSPYFHTGNVLRLFSPGISPVSRDRFGSSTTALEVNEHPPSSAA